MFVKENGDKSDLDIETLYTEFQNAFQSSSEGRPYLDTTPCCGVYVYHGIPSLLDEYSEARRASSIYPRPSDFIRTLSIYDRIHLICKYARRWRKGSIVFTLKQRSRSKEFTEKHKKLIENMIKFAGKDNVIVSPLFRNPNTGHKIATITLIFPKGL